MEKLRIEYVNVSELKPYLNNAKIHTEMYRHLNKLKNEFRIAKMYEAEAKRRK